MCTFFFFILPSWLAITLSIFIMGLVAIIAFLKINNQSVIKIFLNFIGFTVGPKNYVWKKEEPSGPLGSPAATVIKTAQEPQALVPTVSKLNEIKKLVEPKK